MDYLNDFIIFENGIEDNEDNNNMSMTAISDIYGPYTLIVKKICDKYEQIVKDYDEKFQEKNIKFCGILVDCVDFIHFKINQLIRSKEENLKKFEQETYYKSFNRFDVVLNNIQNFIDRISDYGIVRNFFDVELVKKCFYDIINDLKLVCKGLQFNDMTDLIFQQIKENDESLDNHFNETWSLYKGFQEVFKKKKNFFFLFL